MNIRGIAKQARKFKANIKNRLAPFLSTNHWLVLVEPWCIWVTLLYKLQLRPILYITKVFLVLILRGTRYHPMLSLPLFSTLLPSALYLLQIKAHLLDSDINPTCNKIQYTQVPLFILQTLARRLLMPCWLRPKDLWQIRGITFQKHVSWWKS